MIKSFIIKSKKQNKKYYQKIVKILLIMFYILYL